MYKIELKDREAAIVEGVYNWALFGREVEGIHYFESAELDMILSILQQLVEQGYEPVLPRIIEGFRHG